MNSIFTFLSTNASYVTYAFVCIIFMVFAFYLRQAFKIYLLYKKIEAANAQDEPMDFLTGRRFDKIKDLYRKSININTHVGTKSNIPSSNFFSEFNVCKASFINLRTLDSASGTLVGLGLLGTFFGLTLGINGFDSSTAENIKNSINGLLGGMGTAFVTSLAGMFLSMLYTSCDKYWRYKLSKHLYDLTEKLDSAYYIDDVEYITQRNHQTMIGLTNSFTELISTQTNRIEHAIANGIASIDEKIEYRTSDGDIVPIANAVREIMNESLEQTRALKSFSTDLAVDLQNVMDAAFESNVSGKIIPLMQSVERTTQNIIQHIDGVADKVAAPATDMIQNVVSDLKDSMSSIVEDFKSGITNTASDELDAWAQQLGSATQLLASFPQNLDNITTTLQLTINEVKSAISEISNTSASTSSTAMQQMQEQITFATSAISASIAEVKEVMNGISNTSQEQNTHMVNSLMETTEKMSSYMNDTMHNMSSSIQNSMNSITSDVHQKQAALIDEVKSAVLEISTTSANTSSKTMQQMQEQITFATSAIGASIADVKEVMNGISTTSQEQNTHMVNKLMETTERMNSYMRETMQNMSSSMQSTMSSITSDVHQKQSSLIALQEDTISQTKVLLETFNKGLERLEKMNEYISSTMNMFQQAQGQITGSTAHLQNITNDMKQATQLFNSSQKEYTTSIQEAQRNSQLGIENIISVLKNTGEMSQDYVEKFDVIKRGISDIFAQIQTGITEYSKTVKASTQSYLDRYSTSLTDTTDALQSTISHQGELIDMLVEALNSHKK